MQPAYYENLEEIQNKYWSMLDDAVTNRGSPFRIPVFMCANQNEIDGRIVVLRKSDRKNNLIQFHTDYRSSKIKMGDLESSCLKCFTFMPPHNDEA